VDSVRSCRRTGRRERGELMDETWVEETDWNKVARGDCVQVRCDGNVLTGAIADRYVNTAEKVYALILVVGPLTIKVEIQQGTWSLFVPARSAVTLPTEPGYYGDCDGDVWELYAADSWRCLSSGGATEDVEFYAPFVRLELVPDTARRVLDALQGSAYKRAASIWWQISQEVLDSVAAEFGVTDL